MNKIKKLGIVLVALAMCMMLGVTGWAAGDVTYSATPKDATLCVSEKSQRVTVTITANKEIAITSMYLEVIIPEGWSINTVYGSDTVVIGEDNYNTETGKDLIVWYESEAGNKATTDLLTIVYDTSVNAKGTFTLGVENLELATMKDGYNLEVLTKETTVTTTVTIADHAWGDPSYTDNKDGTHTANYVCGNDASHTKSDAPVEHSYTNGECVCGAEEPVKDVAVTYKGTALANAFTVEGNIITVTFDKACKVGYWDEVAGKYVALTATKVSDNTYSFTAPEGVTEVLLVVKGDVSGNGKVDNPDATQAKAIFQGRRTATAEQLFAGDVTGDYAIKNPDVTQIKAVFQGRREFTW